MMDYEEFKRQLSARLSEELGDGFAVNGSDIPGYGALKAGRILVCRKGSNMSMGLHADEYYGAFRRGTPMEKLVADAARACREDHSDVTQAFDGLISDYGTAKKKLCVKLVNTRLNHEMLESVPSVPVLGDLAAVMRIVASEGDESGNAPRIAATVTDRLAESWGVTADGLYADALENMQRMYPPVILNPVTGQTFEPEEGAGTAPMMCMVSAGNLRECAAALLYPGMKERLARMFGGDYILIPSSIHEFMAFADDGTVTADDLKEMIAEGNRDTVRPDEILSDHGYRYSARTGKIESLA